MEKELVKIDQNNVEIRKYYVLAGGTRLYAASLQAEYPVRVSRDMAQQQITEAEENIVNWGDSAWVQTYAENQLALAQQAQLDGEAIIALLDSQE